MLGRLRFTQLALIYLNGLNQIIYLEAITIDCQIPGSNARNISEPECLSLRSFLPNLPGSQYSPSLQSCCFYLFYQLCLVAYIKILCTPLSWKSCKRSRNTQLMQNCPECSDQLKNDGGSGVLLWGTQESTSPPRKREHFSIRSKVVRWAQEFRVEETL